MKTQRHFYDALIRLTKVLAIVAGILLLLFLVGCDLVGSDDDLNFETCEGDAEIIAIGSDFPRHRDNTSLIEAEWVEVEITNNGDRTVHHYKTWWKITREDGSAVLPQRTHFNVSNPPKREHKLLEWFFYSSSDIELVFVECSYNKPRGKTVTR